MKKSINSLELILNMNSRLFNNSLAGITEDQSKHRVSEHNNPINWLAAHTVSARYNMLAFLGKQAANPYNELFANFRAYDPKVTYPTLDESKAEWDKVTNLLNDALGTVSEDHLAADSPLKTPIGDFTNAGTLGFLAQHESYDIGQMAFLKKYLTKEAMSYN